MLPTRVSPLDGGVALQLQPLPQRDRIEAKIFHCLKKNIHVCPCFVADHHSGACI